jgi:ferrous iron transport protein A
MSDKKQLNLNQLNAGESGTVTEIVGGKGMVSRLAAMGILPGKKVTKVSSMLFRGPVTLQVGRAHVAIGFGMAKKVIVEL